MALCAWILTRNNVTFKVGITERRPLDLLVVYCSWASAHRTIFSRGLDPRLVTFLWELKKNATKVFSTSIAGYSLSAFLPSLPSFPSFTPPPLPPVVQSQHPSESHASVLGALRHSGLLRRRGERQPGVSEAQDGEDRQASSLLMWVEHLNSMPPSPLQMAPILAKTCPTINVFLYALGNENYRGGIWQLLTGEKIDAPQIENKSK